MRKKIGFLKKAIAQVNGYFSKFGEKLVSARLTPAEVEAFNGGPKKKKAAAAAPKKVAPVVETVVDEPTIVVTTNPVVQEEEIVVVAPEATK